MENYDSSQIQILEGLKAVRKVPGMYIGSTDARGLHHLVYEVVDNSVDEYIAGVAKSIYITIHGDGSVSVEDDGRGIPVDIHPKYNRPGLEIVLTELHSGAKFDKKVYKITGGLHGVGVHVVNALSSRLMAIVKKGGMIYYEEFSQGIPSGDLESIPYSDFQKSRPEKLKGIDIKLDKQHGTIIWFYPDPEIFETTEFNYDTLLDRVRDLAFLNSQIHITIDDQRRDKKEELHFEGGLSSFVTYLGEGYTPVHKEPIYHKIEIEESVIEFAFQYNTSVSEVMGSQFFCFLTFTMTSFSFSETS